MWGYTYVQQAVAGFVPRFLTSWGCAWYRVCDVYVLLERAAFACVKFNGSSTSSTNSVEILYLRLLCQSFLFVFRRRSWVCCRGVLAATIMKRKSFCCLFVFVWWSMVILFAFFSALYREGCSSTFFKGLLRLIFFFFNSLSACRWFVSWMVRTL